MEIVLYSTHFGVVEGAGGFLSPGLHPRLFILNPRVPVSFINKGRKTRIFFLNARLSGNDTHSLPFDALQSRRDDRMIAGRIPQVHETPEG